MQKKKILITGSSGLVGSILAEGLKDDYDVSGLDVRPSNVIATTIADSSDTKGMKEAFDDVDIVIDLASNPSQYSPWEVIHENNILCTINALEFSQQCGVKRVIFASSNHATGMYELDLPYSDIVSGQYQGYDGNEIPRINTAMPIRPDGPYGIAKAFGEASGRYYSDKYGLSFLALRIGTVNVENKPTNLRQFSTLFTHQDLMRLVTSCIEAPSDLGFGIYYGVSDNSWRIWDTSNAKEDLSYLPLDKAESWRSEFQRQLHQG